MMNEIKINNQQVQRQLKQEIRHMITNTKSISLKTDLPLFLAISTTDLFYKLINPLYHKNYLYDKGEDYFKL